MKGYSVDRAVNSKRRGEMKNVIELYIPDEISSRDGYPHISSYGRNSAVFVYDAITRELKKIIENPLSFQQILDNPKYLLRGRK